MGRSQTTQINNQKGVVEFLNKNIFSRYGVPRKIVMDQGAQLTLNVFEDLMKTNQIRHKQSTPFLRIHAT